MQQMLTDTHEESDWGGELPSVLGGESGLHYSDFTASSGTWWSGFKSHSATSQLWDLA